MAWVLTDMKSHTGFRTSVLLYSIIPWEVIYCQAALALTLRSPLHFSLRMAKFRSLFAKSIVAVTAAEDLLKVILC